MCKGRLKSDAETIRKNSVHIIRGTAAAVRPSKPPQRNALRSKWSETEANNIRTGRHRDILFATHRKRHRRGFHPNISGELPECFAVPLIYHREASVGLTVEKQASRCGENAGPGLGARGSGLRNLPNDLARLNVESAQESLACL